MRFKQLNEAMRFGEREKQKVISDLDSFGFGMEIELNPPEDSMSDDVSDMEIIIEHMDFDDTVSTNETNDWAAVISELGTRDTLSILGHDFFDESISGLSFLTTDVINRLKTIDIDSATYDMFSNELAHGLMFDLFSMVEEKEFVADILANPNSTESIASEITPYVVLRLLMGQNATHSVEYDDDYNYIVDLSMKLNDAIISLAKWLANLPTNAFNDGSVKEMDDLDNHQEIIDWFSSDEFKNFQNALNELPEKFYSDDKLFDDYGDDSDFLSAPVIETYLDMLISDTSKDTINELIFVFGLRDHIDEFVSEMVDRGNDFGVDVDEHRRQSAVGEENIQDVLSKHGVGHYIDEIVEEGDGQKEIITEVITGKDIPSVYNDLFDAIEDLTENHGYYAGSNSGLHMSISYNEGEDRVNTTKFLLLSDLYNILEVDKSSVRNYVSNIFDGVRYAIARDVLQDMDKSIQQGFSNEQVSQDVITDLKFWLSSNEIKTTKYQSVNFQHMVTQDGRIELRFFGGENYQDNREVYWDRLLRAMYALKVSITDEMDKEYHQALYKIMNKEFTKVYGVEFSTAVRRLRLANEMLKKLNFDSVKDAATFVVESGIVENMNSKEVSATEGVLNSPQPDDVKKIKPNTHLMLKALLRLRK